MLFRKFSLSLPRLLPVLVALCCICATSVEADVLWKWEYSAPGIAASGTATTVDVPDANGGYLITSIQGTRNGETITGLQPTGTPIPGNEPFAVDNLLFLGPGAQLTVHGFGFATSGGNYSNPFYADFLPTPGYLEFFSAPPFALGAPGVEDSELPIQFSAAPVPEPAGVALVAAGLFWLALRRAVTRPATRAARTNDRESAGRSA
jgi:hypothetical protein